MADRPQRRAPGATGKVGLRRLATDAFTAIGPHRADLYVVCALGVLVGAFEAGLLLVIARFAVAATSGSDVVELSLGPWGVELTRASCLVVGGVLVLVLIALSFPLSSYTGRVSYRTLVRVRQRLLGAYFAAGFERVDTMSEGTLQELMSEYSGRAERAVNQFTTVLISGFTLVSLGASALLTMPAAAAASVALLALASAAARPAARRVRRRSANAARYGKQLSSGVAQTSRVSEEIFAFDVATAVRSDLEDLVKSAASEVRRVRASSRLVPSLYQYGSLALLLGVAGLLLAISSDSLVALAPLLLILVRSLSYAKQMQMATHAANELSPYIEALERHIEELERGVGGRAFGYLPVTTLERLRLAGVTYSYPSGPEVLHGIDLDVPVGRTTGLIGPSGGGKSTLVQLLLGVREPTSGEVLVNGLPRSSYLPHEWASAVAFVPQDNELIAATIEDNIRFYRPDITAAEVEQAARRAHLHDEIAALPEGYATMVGVGTRSLSGGQRQRLGIARALVGRPQVLILDEPTSALDPRSEVLIRETLTELKAESVTILLVAHRPATLEVCDTVVRLEAGNVTATDVRPTTVAAADLGVSGHR